MQHEFFPREVTSSVPRLTLTGRERLLVEQHQGLLDCQRHTIELKTASGVLSIMGEELTCLRYTVAEALIAGRIDRIEYREGR